MNIQRQLLILPISILCLLALLVWYYLYVQRDIQTQNESIRNWSNQLDKLYIGKQAALRMREILKKTEFPGQDVADLHLDYLEQYRILMDSLKCDICMEGLNPDKRQRLASLSRSLDYKEDIHVETYIPLLNELIPTIDHYYKSIKAQKRGAYMDYYRAVANVGPKITWLSLGVLGVCSLIALWQIFVTARLLSKRLSFLNRQAVDLAAGRLCLQPISTPPKDQLDKLQRMHYQIARQLTEQSTLDSIYSATEEERKRLAMEIHDQTLSELNLINRQLEQCDYKDENKEVIADILGNVQQLAQNLRRIIDDLHPTSLSLVGLQETLEAVLRKMHAQGGPEYYINIDPQITKLLSDKQILYLYRIVVESVTNAFRHGSCHNIEITLRKNRHAYVLTVEDDGEGFDYNNTSGGRGMMNIRSRAQTLGGTVSWSKSRFNQGICVTLKIPLP